MPSQTMPKIEISHQDMVILFPNQLITIQAYMLHSYPRLLHAAIFKKIAQVFLLDFHKFLYLKSWQLTC